MSSINIQFLPGRPRAVLAAFFNADFVAGIFCVICRQADRHISGSGSIFSGRQLDAIGCRLPRLEWSYPARLAGAFCVRDACEPAPGEQPHPVALPLYDHPVAVVLDLVQPVGTGRDGAARVGMQGWKVCWRMIGKVKSRMVISTVRRSVVLDWCVRAGPSFVVFLFRRAAMAVVAALRGQPLANVRHGWPNERPFQAQ